VKTRIFFLTLFSAFALQAQEAPETWSLNECVEMAIEYSYSVRQSANNVKGAYSDAAPAFGAMLPQISGSAGNAWNSGLTIDPVTNEVRFNNLSTANGGLGFGMTLFDGFASFNAWRQAKVNILASQYQYDAAINTVALNTASQYLAVLLAQEAEKVSAEQVKVTQGQQRRAKQLVEAGAAPANELLQLDAQLARDEQRLLTAQNQTNLSYLILAQSMGKPVGAFTIVDMKDSEFNSQPTVISLRPDAIYAASVEDQPAIKAASARVESALLGIKVAQARRLPRLSVNGQWGTSYSDLARKVTGSSSVIVPIGYWDNGGSQVPVYTEYSLPITESMPFSDQIYENQRRYVGLNLSIPIFSGFQVQNGITRSKLNAENAQLQYQQERDNFEQSVQRAHADASAAWSQYQAAQKSLEASKKAMDDANVRRTEGMMTVYDYNAVQNTYLAAVSDVLRAKYDAQFKAYILKFYLQNPLQ
jgi:outer membrane protein